LDALTRRAADDAAFPAEWPARIRWLGQRYGTRLAWIGLAGYVVYAGSVLGFTPARFWAGLGHGYVFLTRLLPPDFVTRWSDIQHDMLESLEIAVLASVFGVLLALPLGLLAARNLMPPMVTWPVRLVVSVSRSFHPVIVGIVFVKAIGFGPLAGVLTLTIASIGFIGKLFTEAIEEISLKQVEAVRATGASFLNVLIFGVMPQVSARFVGFSTYQFDSNLRNSTILGIVGAGGIGGILLAAFQRFDYNIVCAIVMVIIALIMVGEVISERTQRWFQ
jgi:phosphonate transport system permease protein